MGEGARKRWWSFAARGPDARARCALCDRSRAEVSWLVEGRTGYVCRDCALAPLEAFATEAPVSLAFRVLDEILREAPVPEEAVAPLLEALRAVAATDEEKAAVARQAASRDALQGTDP